MKEKRIADDLYWGRIADAIDSGWDNAVTAEMMGPHWKRKLAKEEREKQAKIRKIMRRFNIKRFNAIGKVWPKATRKKREP